MSWTCKARRLHLIAVTLCAFAVLVGHGESVRSEPGLRVCADPDNMPFSNGKGEGFENKLAELIAGRLGRSLNYNWFTKDPRYVPKTTGKDACDLVMGYAQGSGLIEDTNPYYFTSYVLITRANDADLKGVQALSAPQLKGKRIGVFARTPPMSLLALHGLIADSKPFDALSGERHSVVAQKMIGEIASGSLDAGILWGPVGGYYSSLASEPLSVTPLVKEQAGPTTFYGITLGVRPDEPQFKHEINNVLSESQRDIDVILRDYNVPLLDREGNILPAGASQ